MANATLFPDRALLRTHEMEVTGGHRLHVREWGRADGLPALVLHGGPGSGCSPLLWRAFDPACYRVIAPDQRGAGLSTPRGGVAHNTTADLLADLRRLRRHLGVERWLVVGGSWGATLALAHALDMPEAVAGLLLRASFLSRAQDIARFFGQPPPGREATWRRLADAVAPRAGQGLLQALHEGLHAGGDDAATRARRETLALAWWRWERALSQGSGGRADLVDDAGTLDAAALAFQVDRLRVQSHYLLHACWLDDPPLDQRCAALPTTLPVLLLHGRADLVCPPEGAALLHARLAGSHLHWVDDAGHDPTHPAMAAAMMQALDSWCERGAWA